MATIKEMVLSNDFGDYIVPATSSVSEYDRISGDFSTQRVNDNYWILHLNNFIYPINTIRKIGFSAIPKLFTINSTVSLEQSGILQVQRNPNLNLTGKGVLIGFVDTGINYMHPAFLDSSGSTRILSIWDQTIQTGTPPGDFIYGTEYTSDQINQALASDAPLSIVPSVDSNGHGSLLAGIAAGRSMSAEDFAGAAPDSYIAMVKLKEAKQYLKDFFFVNGNTTPVYQETDIMMGIQYLAWKADELGLPLVICLGLGTNQGSHNGTTPLDNVLSLLRTYNGLSIVVAAGNEAGMAHHYYGRIPQNSYDEVEIEVPENTSGFSLELWGLPPEIYSIGAVTPLGEVIQRIPARFGESQTIDFVLERSVFDVSYELVEPTTSEQVIFIRLRDPTPGIWRIRVYCNNCSNGQFHMWLPVTGLNEPNVIFLNPNPYTTITVPGNGSQVITTASYNAVNNALYLNSGRGFTPMNRVKPDITAPGVNVSGPDLRNGYITATGTGAAAALTAGSSALLMEWGTRRFPVRIYYTNEIKSFFIRGATRTDTQMYPNREWGYGTLNVYQVYTSLLNP